MAKSIAEVTLSDGSTFLAEVEHDPPPPGGRMPVSLASDAREGRINFDEALKNIETAAGRFVETQRKLVVPPDECEIQFGIKVSAEGNAILAKVGGDVNFSVTLKWSRKDST
jgi:hypothetical protein